MSTATDDTGTPFDLGRPVRRVVSLVPSLTEAVEVSAPGLVVGATDWCTHPAGLDVQRVGGTKNPDVARITELRPDVVLVNEEENRLVDVQALRAHGIAVWATDIRTVDDAFGSLARMLQACGVAAPPWLVQARHQWQDVPTVAPQRLRALVPIWRRPWMALGSDTFAGDVLRRLGVDNVLADDAARYPRFDMAALPELDLVVLPDEPYSFSAQDGPEAFQGLACALVSGRHLTWYGPSMVEAVDVLTRGLRGVSPADHASDNG